jgi:hypothetical protein
MAWPLQFPDLTPLQFSLWGCVKDSVYIPPLPATLHEHRHRINDAFAHA